MSVHSSGRVTRTLSAPGTGLSYVSTSSTRGGSAPRSTARTDPAAGAAAAPQVPPRPGLMAPRWEKDLFTAVEVGDIAALAGIAAAHPVARSTCLFLDAFLGAIPRGDLAAAKYMLDLLWTEGYDPSRDVFLDKYLPTALLEVSVATGIVVQLTPDRDSLGLMVAELRQTTGDLSGAIGVVKQLTPTTVAAVSLADLYADQQRWQDVIDLTNEVPNNDEFGTSLLIQRGVALREQGLFPAARESLKGALAVRGRPVELRHWALIERGQTYLAEGKLHFARKDFEKVLAENVDYPGLDIYLARTKPT